MLVISDLQAETPARSPPPAPPHCQQVAAVAIGDHQSTNIRRSPRIVHVVLCRIEGLRPFQGTRHSDGAQGIAPVLPVPTYRWLMLIKQCHGSHPPCADRFLFRTPPVCRRAQQQAQGQALLPQKRRQPQSIPLPNAPEMAASPRRRPPPLQKRRPLPPVLLGSGARALPTF